MPNIYSKRKLRSNNHSGYPGISWDKKSKKWVASIKYRYKSIYIGAFKDIDDAIAARKKMEIAFDALSSLNVTHFEFIKDNDGRSYVCGYIVHGYKPDANSVIYIEGPNYA